MHFGDRAQLWKNLGICAVFLGLVALVAPAVMTGIGEAASRPEPEVHPQQNQTLYSLDPNRAAPSRTRQALPTLDNLNSPASHKVRRISSARDDSRAIYLSQQELQLAEQIYEEYVGPVNRNDDGSIRITGPDGKSMSIAIGD